MPATVTFAAESLEDIAAHFDDMAERAAVQASHASTKRAQSIANAESRTWTRAAEVLRTTTLKGQS